MKKYLIIVWLLSPFMLFAQSSDKAQQLFEKGQYAEAKAIYERLLKSNSKYPLYNYRLARCLQETGDHRAAIEYFQRAGSRYELTPFFMANSYMALWMPEEAVTCYREYLSHASNKEREAFTQTEIKRAEIMRRYIKRVQNVAIIDTFHLHKSSLLSVYQLSREAGILQYDSLGYTTYTNAQNDRRILTISTNKNGDTICSLASQYRLLDQWANIESLPQNVNFTTCQLYPFLMSDGVTLYFAAQDSDGIGGLDIYMNRYNSATNTYYQAENLGYPFNSPANDYLYAVDEVNGCGYFASDRGCSEDSVVVYQFRLEETPRYISGFSSDTIGMYAELRLFEHAAPRVVQVDSLLWNDTPKLPVEKEIDFIVNAQLRYTTEQEFVSAAALQAFHLYVEKEQTLREEQDKLNTLRQTYGRVSEAEKERMKSEILCKEKLVNTLQQSSQQMLTKARLLENQALESSKQ